MIDRSIVIVWIGSVVLILALAGLVHLVAYIYQRIKARETVKHPNCKECKYYRKNPYATEEYMMCMYWNDWIPTEENDFCSRGERRVTND